jgi:hypothetical protein
MKFQKLDPKQVPQVAALGVLSLGVLGFAGFSFLSSLAPAAATQPPAGKAEAAPAAGADKAKAGSAAQIAQAGTNGPALQLPAIFNPDPFHPAVTPKAPPGAAVKPAAPAHSEPKHGAQRSAAYPPSLPAVAAPGSRPSAAPSPGAPAAPLLPPAPVRPTVSVSGIIDAQDGPDMALAEVDSVQRIIQVGDVLPNKYRVKRIQMDGVLLVNGKDRFFVALGSKAQAANAGAPAAAPGQDGKGQKS